jgi:hypothetical protein
MVGHDVNCFDSFFNYWYKISLPDSNFLSLLSVYVERRPSKSFQDRKSILGYNLEAIYDSTRIILWFSFFLSPDWEIQLQLLSFDYKTINQVKSFDNCSIKLSLQLIKFKSNCSLVILSPISPSLINPDEHTIFYHWK